MLILPFVLLLLPTTLARNSNRDQPLSPRLFTAQPAALAGLSQFSNLLPAPILLTLQTTLSLLPVSAFKTVTAPLTSAFAALKLTLTQEEQATLAAAQACVTAIVEIGYIPSGSACVDQFGNTASSYGVAFDTVLEQFVGIVPPATLTAIQTEMSTYFLNLGLIPPANDLYTAVNNAIASVTASTAGNTVTGVEVLQKCFQNAVQGGELDTIGSCFNGPNSALVSLNTIFAGVVQQFVGYLPPNVVSSVINIYSFYFSQTGFTPGIDLMNNIDLSLNSITAAVAGNGATFLLQMQQCFNNLIMSPDPSDFTCVVGKEGPILTLEVIVNGIIQQAFGFLPPTAVLQLQQDLSPYLATSDPSASAITAAFKATLQAASLGPAFVTCVEALEDCVNNAVLGSETTCDLETYCKPLVESAV
ncbi:hypothetical protein MNV49_007183 [Pseudohyphozyma bogoriensis]|nr:hypothetical protein MNV49_007183 [Pseudohyphozyma bogoriensis]